MASLERGWRGNAYGKTTVDMGIIASLLKHTSSSSMVYGKLIFHKDGWKKCLEIRHSGHEALIKMCQNKLKQQVTLLWFSSMNDWEMTPLKRRLLTTVWYMNFWLSCLYQTRNVIHSAHNRKNRHCFTLNQQVWIPENTSWIHFARANNTQLFATLIKLGTLIALAGLLQSANNGAS